MLRFDSSNRRPPRNYLSRREQWRLLMLIVPLGVAILLMRQLGTPERAQQVNNLFAEADVNDSSQGQGSVTQSDASERPAKAEQAPLTTERDREEVDRSLLRDIEDNTYFRDAEQEAWFHLLGILKAASVAEIVANKTSDVTYVQLVEQPHAYRGRLVSVKGRLVDVTRQTPAANELPIDSYYRVVLEPTAGAKWPIFIYCLQPPGETAASGQPRRVEAVGYFFKNLSYPSDDGLGIAPVVLAKELTLARSAPVHDTADPSPQVDVVGAQDARQSAADTGGPQSSLEEVLAIAGWDAERFDKFEDGAELSEDERREALQLLRRTRMLGGPSLEAWAKDAATIDRFALDPGAQRGRLVRLRGRVQQVTRRVPPAEGAQRLEITEYYECEMSLDDVAPTATILAARVPKAWLAMPALDEPASAVGFYLKQLPADEDGASALFVADAIAWHPTQVNALFLSFGESLLGAQGFDVGLLDTVRNHRPLLDREREAFYQMLRAVGQFPASQLARAARRNLREFKAAWSSDRASADPSHRALAEEVLRRADEGAYSVAPLFNDADNQVGQIFVFDGTARRVVRVEVGTSATGDGPSDVLRRFGLDHYFEMEVFTDDSQNRPLIFCVRELPTGFPTGGDVRVPVRVAGFFFKSWRYRTGDTNEVGGAQGLTRSEGRPKISPLLIGPAPLRLKIEPSGGELAGVIGVVVFATMAGVWGALWWWRREDRRFHARRMAPEFKLPTSAPLNDLEKLEHNDLK